MGGIFKMDYNQCLVFIIRLFLIITIITLSNFIITAYDSASSSCDPRSSRRARAQILSSIPCDLQYQGYCNLPGNSYPWHAVRRFVTENQGLMRRMYGDLRHISVLKTEIDNNDIEFDDIQETAERYSRKGHGKNIKRKQKYLHSEYQIHRNNDVLLEPYFRPTSTSTSTQSTTTTTTIKSTPTTMSAPSSTSSSTSSTQPSTVSTTLKSTSTSTSVPSKLEPNKVTNNHLIGQLKVDELTLADLIETSIETNNVFLNLTHTDANIVVVEPPNLTINKTHIPSTISTTLKLVSPFNKFIEDSTIKTTLLIPDKNMKNITVTEKGILDTTTETTSKILQNIPIERDEEVTEEDYFIAAESEKIEKFEQKDENLGESLKFNKPSAVSSSTMEGQLFQDVVERDANSPIVVVRGKGVNACPVKEEVVAPFWANNTRGEVLALLNLYPFEQYVHWEKCTNENKQMYCRDGCRCEQQYSLHRLLAYDPHNDCRGIFSDWFRFPSCCVCKCYDVPGIEFRGTSRSPRSEQINAAEEELRKAIYNHATEDWYRPKDDFYST